MDKETAIEKIKKCLSLAKSQNENEAAIALKQANALMRKFNLEYRAVLAGEVNEVRVRTRYKSRPMGWDQLLVSQIGRQFDCEVLMIQNPHEWVFLGLDSNAQVAAYAYDVLMNQVRNSSKRYLKTNHASASTALKRKLGRLYCQGWVSNLAKRIEQFAGASSSKEHISAYLQQSRYNVEQPKDSRRKRQILSALEWVVYTKGAQDGEHAKLHRGVGANMDEPLQLQ